MKTKIYGESNKPKHTGKGPIDRLRPSGAAQAVVNYRAARENGSAAFSPNREFPEDGDYTWVTPGEAKSKIRYTGGPGDRDWMEERDRNYVFRLEQEGRLDEVEPNLQTEIPQLYAEVMAERKERTEKESIKKEIEETSKKVDKLNHLGELDRLKKEQNRLEQKLSISGNTSRDSNVNAHNSNNVSVQGYEEKSFDTSYLIPYSALEFGRELGKGGFGAVYQGRWQFVDVAIKQLYLTSLAGSALTEFQSEAAMMTKLHHDNVVALRGVSIDNPGHYSLVMEYMPQGSLYAVLHNQQPLDWDLRYRISMDICAGLFHLHEQNILHRDLKSMNVLLDDRMRAKLSDFGLSKLRNESTATSTKVGGSAVGTIPWMSPELFRRKGIYTKASDIYSLGMIFWEIASRLLPFAEAQDPQQIIAWKSQGDNEDIPEDCPPKYGELISECWKDKDQRPTIQALAQSLKSIFQVSAESVSPSILQSGPVYQLDSQRNVNESGPAYQFETQKKLDDIKSGPTYQM